MPPLEVETIAVPRFARAHDYAGVWAIEPTAGAAMWERCRRTDIALHVSERSGEAPKLRSDIQLVKVGAGAQAQTIAIVMLAGPLMKQVASMEAGTSTVQARRDIRKAAADPEVSAILVLIDSPGGSVSGTADLGADIAAAAKQKPTWSFIDDLGASAAYWIASQTEKVFANNNTALVGSIGTLLVVYDLSGAAEQQGVKALVFGTGPVKGAGTPGAPVTEEQQAYFRGLVDDAQTSFDAAVRKGRGLTAKQLADAKTGGVFPASEALDRGLIDGIQSMDKTLADLATEARRHSRSETTRAEGPTLERSSAVEPTTPIQTENPAAPTTKVAPPADPIAAYREQMAAESDRIAGIQRVAKSHATIVSQAIRENWSVEKTELASMKADLNAHNVRPFNPAIVVPGGPGGRPSMAPGVSLNDAIAAAVCLAIGNPTVEKRFKAEVLQAADDHFRGIGLQQMLLMAAAQNGYHCRPGERITQGNLREVMKAAFTPSPGLSADGGPSSISLPGILGNVANKELLTGYMEEDQSWRDVANVKPVNNFHQVTSYRMLDSMEYEEIGPAGKIKHGTASQESYTRQAKTYAKMFALTRQDWINDDLGAFQDLRNRLGRGSAKKFNNVFWTKFLTDHATFFTAARTNYISGNTSNLGTDGVGLGLGVKAFRLMTTPEADGSKRIGGMADRLIVPPELEGTAEVLYRNQNLGAVKTSDANIYANRYRPVVVPWLSDPSFTGYSTTAWYLGRPTTDLAMMVVSFLNGMQAPTVESADADFDTLGVLFRGYHDFGADQAEYLALLKSKGAA